MNSIDDICPNTPLYSSKINVDDGDNNINTSKTFGIVNSTEECPNLLTVTPIPKAIPPQAASTPGSRMKLCLKRLRRRSAEIFKPKAAKMPTPEKPDPYVPMFLRMKEVFRRKVPSGKVMKKSVSTPILSRKKQSLSETDLTPDGDKFRKGESALFSEGRVFNRTLEELQPPDGGPIRFQFGERNEEVVNFGYNSISNDQSKSLERTPVIRKSLYPDLKKKGKVENFAERFGSKKKAQKDIRPTILKPNASTLIVTNFDCCDIMNGLTLEENKLTLNEAAYAKFKERRSYRKLAENGLANHETGGLQKCVLVANDDMIS